MFSSPSQFALAIVFPGTGNMDVVTAAVRHHVHVVDKEVFDAKKDYAAESKRYEPYINGSRILLLFIFQEGTSILADTENNLDIAIRHIQEISN
jgi:hypothetical protein